MNLDEEVARAHLLSQGRQVRPHPDGQHLPPDLLVDGTIAVEVRRLNQNERDRDRPKGLEQEAIPLTAKLDNLLATFGTAGKTHWGVALRLKRPLPRWARLRRTITTFLQRVLDEPDPPSPVELDVDGKVKLRLARRSDPTGPTFALWARTDADMGPWLMEEYERNLRLCIAEKTAKVSAYRMKYPEWWLLFVDHIGYAIPSEESRRAFRATIALDHDWHRVLLVNPLDHTQYFEV